MLYCTEHGVLFCARRVHLQYVKATEIFRKCDRLRIIILFKNIAFQYGKYFENDLKLGNVKRFCIFSSAVNDRKNIPM